jgi:hypothetical protein
MVRPGTAARPLTARRPYSAYTRREGEAENEAKCDPPQTNREWWRYYVKVFHKKTPAAAKRGRGWLRHVNKPHTIIIIIKAL